MATVSKTFAFAADAETLTDQAVSGVAFAFESTDGNPAGCVTFTFGTKNTTAIERARGSGTTWETFGVPAGATVNTARVVSYSRKVAANAKLNSHSHAIRIVGIPDLASEALPTATGGWLVGGGIAAAQTVAGTSTDSALLEIEYTVSTSAGGGGASTDARFDQIAIEIDYTESAPSYTGSGGVAFSAALAGSGSATSPGISGPGGVTFPFALAGSGEFTPAPVAGSGAVAFSFAVAGSGSLAAPAFTGTGAVAFGVALSGSGSFTPAAISGSGGVAFGFSASGSSLDDIGPWITHGVIHYTRPLNHW